MIALIPIASTLCAVPILKEKPTLQQVFFSALSVGGVIGIGIYGVQRGAAPEGGKKDEPDYHSC